MKNHQENVSTMLKLASIIAVILLTDVNCGTVENEFLFFLKDYFSYYDKTPSLVISLLCWNMQSQLALNSAFSVMGKAYGNIKTFQHIYPTENSHQMLFLMDFSCFDTERHLKEADQKELFKAPHKWIILINGENDENNNDISLKASNLQTVASTEKLIGIHSATRQNIYESLKRFTILPDSNVVLAIREGVNQITLISVYKRRPTSELIKEHLGHWMPNNLTLSGVQSIIALRRINLDKTIITSSMVILNNDSINHLDDYRNNHIDSLSKSNYKLNIALVNFLNGTIRFKFVDTWGYKNKEGIYNGMIGDFLRDKADIGGTPLFIIEERLDILKYVAMTTPTTVRFIFRQPPLSYVENIFILPFSGVVWGAILLLIVLICFFLYATSVWEDIRKDGKYRQQEEWRLRGNVSDIALFAFSAIFQQGSHEEPRSPAGRMLTLFLFLPLLFFFTSYSANIVALLQSKSNSINSLESLLHSRMELGAEDTPYHRFYFPQQTDQVRKDIWLKKMNNAGTPSYMNLSEGIKKVRNGLFAFHVELGPGYHMIVDTFKEDEKCGLRELKYLQLIDPWLPIQRNSSFAEMFKLGYQRIREHGLSVREASRVYTSRPKCSGKESSFDSVGVVNAMYPFIWLAAGCGLALFVLIIEKIIYISTKRQEAIHQRFKVSTEMEYDDFQECE